MLVLENQLYVYVMLVLCDFFKVLLNCFLSQRSDGDMSNGVFHVSDDVLGFKI